MVMKSANMSVDVTPAEVKEETVSAEEKTNEEDTSSSSGVTPPNDDEKESDEEQETEGSESLEDDSDDNLGDEIDLDSFDTKKKSGVQRRIDKLTAKLKAAEEEREYWRQNAVKDNKAKKDEPEYSDEELAVALKQALSDGNESIVLQIMKYREKKLADSLRQEYLKEQEKATETTTKIAKEWQSIVTDYSEFYDTKEPEIYPGSHGDLNLKDNNSLIVRLARKFYNDPDQAERYRVDGGQRLAVSDALRYIIKERSTKKGTEDTKQLKKRLAKEKRKTSMVSGGAGKEESIPQPKDDKQRLHDYIAERKQMKKQRMGNSL